MNCAELPWPTANPRARDEWNFSRQRLPNSEVSICHEYELGRIRQSESWRRSILEFRNNAQGTTFDAYLKYLHDSRLAEKPLEWPNIFYTLWPEWPNHAYLTVPASERARRIRLWFTDKDSPLPMVSLRKIFAAHLYALSCCKAGLPVQENLPEIGDTINDGLGIIVAVNLSLFDSDEELHQSFQRSLDILREDYDVPNPENRGAASGIRRLRGELIAIGAWRLLCSGLTRKQAMVHMANHSDSVSISAHPSAWTRALKTARNVIPHQYHYLTRLTDKKS